MFQIKISINDKPTDEIALYAFDSIDGYDNILDDISSLLDEVCLCLAQSKKVVFLVQGFGQALWPVDVSTDLLTFVEQLPDLLGWFDSRRSDHFVLDFYEQGIERRLLFQQTKEVVCIVCESWSRWQPDPNKEILDWSAFKRMIDDCVRTFVRGVKEICPQSYNHQEFQKWINQDSVLPHLMT